MKRTFSKQRKISLLRQQGNFNSHFEKVADSSFLDNDFFDPQDIVQVKYEMLRCARLKKTSIKEVVKNFGFSRTAFYKTLLAFKQKGLAGLIPQKRGPQGRHKLSEKVMESVLDAIHQDPSLSKQQMAHWIKQQHGLDVHPRSIARALHSRDRKNEKKK